MKNKFTYLLLATIGLSVASCGNKDAGAPAPGPAELDVINVPIKSLTGYNSFPATVEGKVNNDVRAKIQGYIKEVLVHEGQAVSKGQILFRLETNSLTESAAAAKAGIAAAQSSVSIAQVEVNKLIPLVDKKIISPIQLETAKANLASAKSMLAQARANYGSIEANIDYGVVRSPINGIVGSLPLKTGSLVGPNDQIALTTVSDVSEMFANFSMNEKEYLAFLQHAAGTSLNEKIKNMPLVSLVLADGSVYAEKGRVETVSGQVSGATGTVQFRVAFKNPNRLLTNGNSGKIRIPVDYINVLVVPEAATFEQQGVVNLYRVERDTAFATQVEVLDRIDNMAIINKGLKEGDAVIVTGVGSLKNKTAVKPKKVDFDKVVAPLPSVF